MPDPRLVRVPQSSVETARAELAWLDDEDAAVIGVKDPASAVALSLITGGGGHFYVGDNVTGYGLTLAALTALIAGPFLLPTALAVVLIFGVLAGSAALVVGKVKKVNRYVVARHQQEAAIAGHPTHKLLHAMLEAGGHPSPPATTPAQPTPPQPHDPLVDKLRKLIHLRDANVISELEHAERKVDLLTAAASGASRDQIDELLFELLPLLREGTITEQDVEFLKSLAI
jgi:hypothetical protein